MKVGKTMAGTVIAAVSLSVLAATVPAQAESRSRASTSAAPAARWTGEEVFRGLYFGQGEVARHFEELRGARIADNAEARSILDGLVSKIRQKDASFFEEFGADMTSGDRVRINARFLSTQKVIEEIAATETHMVPAATGKDAGRCAVVAAVAGVTVYVAAVLVVNAAIGANVVAAENWFWGRSAEGGALDQERWVNQVAVELAA
ncbi:sporulation delaying protein family toxin [Streptomyces sp. NPDC092307]|uniref:sporulation delaying protein family toxin n=1 Tax=Streptomyces sp. NPDC092307 TaxID=3366013 RepID=UPI003827948C